MRVKRANIDSLNLAGSHIEGVFIHHSDYEIETAKSKSVFHPKIWSETFGKALKRHMIEAKIIHSYLGVDLPLKTFSANPQSQTVEFAGLYGYNERSKLLRQLLQELKSRLQNTRVMRLDIAIDFSKEIPTSIIKALSKHRQPFRYGNTTYYKTKGEKKTNQKVDIKIYNKAHQAHLDFPLYRLEFVFKGNYFSKLHLKDLDLIINKMEKSIKRTIGIDVKIGLI